MSAPRAFLDIHRGERRNTFAAFATLLSITTGHTLLETARDAFFLAKMPATQLPWMYLLMVAFALVISQIKAARAHSKWSVAGSLAVAAGITTVFWALLHHGGHPTHNVLYALYVWTGLFGSWAMVQVWTLLGRVHDMSQAKRLYGFIGGGSVLGGVVGAVLARVSISMLSPRSAVLLAAAIFLLSAFPCLLIKFPADEPTVELRGDRGDELTRRQVSATMGVLWENAFARQVLGIVLASTITVTIADYLFKSQIAAEITDTRRLGNYLSSFYAVTNGLSLVAQIAIAPWVFRRLGVQRALFIFPATMAAAAAAIVGSGGVFAAAVLLKGLDGAFRYSIHKTSTELLLVPVPDLIRERIKPVVDLVGSRGGQALASLVIIALVATSTDSPVILGAIVLGLSVVWVGLVVTIRKLYLDVFRETLKSGGLSGQAELPELDLGALETLFAGLNSSRDADVIASLELLAEQHRERLIPALILYHPSRDVVLRALDIFTEMGRTDFVSIADRLNAHPDRQVAAAALRARTAVLPDKDLLLERVNDSCEQVAITALVALMARGWISLEDANRRFDVLKESRSWESMAELARAIRTVAPTRGPDAAVEDRFDDVLIKLDEHAARYRDRTGSDESEPARTRGPAVREGSASLSEGPPDILIRLEIARAMAVRKSPRFIPSLVNMLNRHELRPVAREALVQIPGALEALDHAMSAPQIPRDIRVHIPRTICLFEPRAAAQVLMRHLTNTPEGAVRFKVIRGLVKLHRQSPHLKVDPTPLVQMAEQTLDHAEELQRWGEALALGDHDAPKSVGSGAADPLQAAHHLLSDLVHDKEVHALQRVFMLLELIHDEPFDDIWRGLRGKNAKARASSLELLENLVEDPFRHRILRLVGENAERTRESLNAMPALSYEAAILEILGQRSQTMRLLAEYRATELGLDVSQVPRPSRPEYNPFGESLGSRLIDKVKGALAPDENSLPGATNAPA